MSVFKFFDYTHSLGNFSWLLQILTDVIHVAWVSFFSLFSYTPENPSSSYQMPLQASSNFLKLFIF